LFQIISYFTIIETIRFPHILVYFGGKDFKDGEGKDAILK